MKAKKTVIIIINVVFWVLMFLIGYFLLFVPLSGCAWQGQKHQAFDHSGKITLNSEWWSMRFLWMSNGIECYTQTPYYTSGAMIERSQTDPNAVKAIVEGVVNGIKTIP